MQGNGDLRNPIRRLQKQSAEVLGQAVDYQNCSMLCMWHICPADCAKYPVLELQTNIRRTFSHTCDPSLKGVVCD